MYVKILHIFCLPLIRDGFLILIILSRKSRPVPVSKQSSLCGPLLDLCRALNNTKKKKTTQSWSYCSFTLAASFESADGSVFQDIYFLLRLTVQETRELGKNHYKK